MQGVGVFQALGEVPPQLWHLFDQVEGGLHSSFEGCRSWRLHRLRAVRCSVRAALHTTSSTTDSGGCVVCLTCLCMCVRRYRALDKLREYLLKGAAQ